MGKNSVNYPFKKPPANADQETEKDGQQILRPFGFQGPSEQKALPYETNHHKAHAC